MPFPVVARYFLNFRNSDTGLTPGFTFFQRADTFGATTPASPVGGIIEKSNGEYYFDWTWNAKTDPDIIFVVDGGASIPTEEVRYIKGAISPRDRFLDEPISQVVTDVWTDNTSYSSGQKGKRVDQIGDPSDNGAAQTVFGKIAALPSAANIATAVWDTVIAGHLTAGTTGKALYDSSNFTDSSIADAVWNKDITGISQAGRAGKSLTDALAHALLGKKVAMGKWLIAAFQLTLYDEDGTTPIQVFDLKDDNGNPTNTKIYRRDPTL